MALTKTEEDFLRMILTKNIDLHGRRIINAGKSIDEDDYVTQEELNALIARIAKLEQKVGK